MSIHDILNKAFRDIQLETGVVLSAASFHSKNLTNEPTAIADLEKVDVEVKDIFDPKAFTSNADKLQRATYEIRQLKLIDDCKFLLIALNDFSGKMLDLAMSNEVAAGEVVTKRLDYEYGELNSAVQKLIDIKELS